MTAPVLVLIAHRGLPCDPPVVEGIPFRAHPEDSDLYLAEVTEEQALDLTRIPAFTRYGGNKPVAPQAGQEQAPGGDDEQDAPKRPVATWSNHELLALLKERGVEVPEGSKRADLLKLVTASNPGEEGQEQAPAGQE